MRTARRTECLVPWRNCRNISASSRAGTNRCRLEPGVRGENVGRRYDLERGIKIELLLDDIETNAFERQERRVPFVHVKHVRLECRARSALSRRRSRA